MEVEGDHKRGTWRTISPKPYKPLGIILRSSHRIDCTISDESAATRPKIKGCPTNRGTYLLGGLNAVGL